MFNVSMSEIKFMIHVAFYMNDLIMSGVLYAS